MQSVSNKAELFMRVSGSAEVIRSFGIEKISVFGSFARDNKISGNSDIDFLLDFEHGKKSYDNLVELGDYLENLLGRKVELLTRESLKSDVGRHIIESSEEIHF